MPLLLTLVAFLSKSWAARWLSKWMLVTTELTVTTSCLFLKLDFPERVNELSVPATVGVLNLYFCSSDASNVRQ